MAAGTGTWQRRPSGALASVKCDGTPAMVTGRVVPVDFSAFHGNVRPTVTDANAGEAGVREGMRMSQDMILHWSPRSPYVRKVMIAAHEIGVQDRIRTVRTVVGGTTPHLQLMTINPLGKIPTLGLPDGSALYDSPVIIEYLDTLHAGAKLYPETGPERLTALRRHALGQGMLDSALLLLAEGFRPAERQSEPHKALWLAKLRACTAALEGEAAALASSGFTIGHLAIGVALAYLDFRFAELNWRDNHPRLSDWQAGFNARRSVQACPPIDDR